MKPLLRYVHWSDKDEKLCRRLLDEGRSAEYVAHLLGRTPKAVRNKMLSPRTVKVQSINKTVSADLLRARDQRLRTPPRDLTAAFFGDPLPGHSALERRT